MSKKSWALGDSHLMPHTMGLRPVFEKSQFPENIYIRVTYRTDREALMALLPEGMEPVGEPKISFVYRHSERVDWVLGGELNLVGVRIDAVFKGKNGDASGAYMPALWEDDFIAVILGRELFGIAKLYADISNPIIVDGNYRALLSEDGRPLIEIKISNLKPIEGEKLTMLQSFAKNTHALGWKQFPTADMMGVELGHVVHYPSSSTITEAWSGDGEVTLFDIDPQIHIWTHPIMKVLKAVPLHECLGASLSRGSSEICLSECKTVQ